MGLDDNESNEEPSAAEIADACKDVLDAETCAEIAGMDMEDEDTLGAIFAYLEEAGIEDPEAFLIEKGILLPTETEDEEEK